MKTNSGLDDTTLLSAKGTVKFLDFNTWPHPDISGPKMFWASPECINGSCGVEVRGFDFLRAVAQLFTFCLVSTWQHFFCLQQDLEFITQS